MIVKGDLINTDIWINFYSTMNIWKLATNLQDGVVVIKRCNYGFNVIFIKSKTRVSMSLYQVDSLYREYLENKLADIEKIKLNLIEAILKNKKFFESDNSNFIYDSKNNKMIHQTHKVRQGKPCPLKLPK